MQKKAEEKQKELEEKAKTGEVIKELGETLNQSVKWVADQEERDHGLSNIEFLRRGNRPKPIKRPRSQRNPNNPSGPLLGGPSDDGEK